MKKYFYTIITILFFGLISCSNDETKTQNQVVARPSLPILDDKARDIDGNIYNIVTIGTQKWLRSNLNVSHYRNGDPIPQVTDATQWSAVTTGAWCYYGNNTPYGNFYHKLYNWYAVNDPRGLAPTGYHVPSDAEWTTLTTFLGGESVAGNKMKTTTIWIPYSGIINTNSSGFTGLPGGFRENSSGSFYYVRNYGTWWSSTEDGTTYAWSRSLHYYNGDAYRSYDYKNYGFSVRCVRD